MALKKTELFIENFKVDLFGDEAFILNYNIADINDISAKVSSYSKEIDIPSTKENNKTFSHLYDVNSEGYFNPISKKTAQIYVDGVCVMKGYFKLNSVTIINNDYVTYHGVLYEDSLNFMQTLGELDMTNLDMQIDNYIPPTQPGPPQFFYMYGYTYTDYQYMTYIPTNKRFNLNATQCFINGGVGNYGSFQGIPKSGNYWAWGGSAPVLDTNPTVNAFVASVPCQIIVKAQAFNQYNGYFYQVGYMKVFETSPGVWLHTPITPPGIITNVSTTTIPSQMQATNTIILTPGEGFYMYYKDVTWRYTGASAPPLVVTGAFVYGSIQELSGQSGNGVTITEGYIIQNQTQVVNSDDSDFCFPLIDYNQTYPLSATGLKYNELAEGEKPAVRVLFEDLRPALFVKKIWDTIFEQAGFKYKSKFLDTNADIFKKLISIGGMEETDVEVLVQESKLTSNYQLVEPIQDKNVPATGQQTGYEYKAFLLGGYIGNWQTTSYRYEYLEEINNTFQYANYSTSTNHGYSGAIYGKLLYGRVAGKYRVNAKIDAISQSTLKNGSVATGPFSQILTYRLKIETIAGGSYQNDPSLFTPPSKSKWKEIKVVNFIREDNTSNQPFVLELDEVITLKKGELCRVTLYGSAEAQRDPNNTSNVWKSRTLLNSANDVTFVKFYRCGSWVGSQIQDLSSMLPRKMKQAEFILGIAKMFNLFFEPSKQDPNTIVIEPRDVYYEDGRVLNWEKKLDYNKPIEIGILPHDQAKNFVFKYMDDGSDYNTEEFKKYTPNGLNFGSYKFTSGDEYVTDTQELELPFAASYLQMVRGTEPSGYPSTMNYAEYKPIIITKIIDKESQKPSYNGDPSSWKKEPRILYYGGKTLLPPPQDRDYDLKYIGTYINVTYEHPATLYAYAGHYDRLIHPRFDLNFYTDNHYYPNSYWTNGYVPLGTSTTSNTTINLSTLVIGNNVSMNKGANINWFLSSYVNKYIKVYNLNSPANNYFIGLVVQNAPSTVTLKVVSVSGSLSSNNWQMQMIDVDMKENLFKSFYEKQMLELTDQTSRMMTANFYLNPVDIANFKFNDVIYAHKEYWRVNKIVDYDTSSDVTQTTKVELVKLLRADTQRLIDYTKGGYFGVAGGIIQPGNGSVVISTNSLPNALIVSSGNGGEIAEVDDLASLQKVLKDKNKILQNADGTITKYFNSTTTINTGTSDIQDSIKMLNETVSELKNSIDNAPISTDKSITVTTDTDRFVNVEEGVTNVFFDNLDRNQLWQIQIQDNQVDGFSVLFEPLGATDIAFIQIVNPTATTNDIMVVNIDNRVVVKYDEATNVWQINKL